MPHNAVVVGCGAIGSTLDDAATEVALTHATGYETHDQTRLVAGVDPSSARRSAFRSSRDAPAYSSVDVALTNHEIDLVSVCTPPETHLEVVERSVSAGVQGVLCEKPLAADSATARRIVDRCRRAGVPLAVNYTRRYLPGCRTARAMLKTGTIDDLHRAVLVYNKGFLANGSHMVDLARWWFGDAEDATVVAGDNPDAILTFGETPTHLVYAGNDAYNHVEVDVYGHEGRVQLVDHSGRLLVSPVRDAPLFDGYRDIGSPSTVQTGIEWMCYFAVNDLVRAVEASEPVACDGEDALKTLELCERLRSP